MEHVLVSACLLGSPVRYDGGHQWHASEVLARWIAEGRAVSACPEVSGGLPVPRLPAEIAGGAHGTDVLAGRARVHDLKQVDVTQVYVSGAYRVLAQATRMKLRVAVLKDGSPSCGSSHVYDGSFSGTRVRAQGVTAALLARHGIQVFSENEFERANRYVMALEAGT